MTTRATQNELPSPLLDDNLFLPVPDTNFRDLVAETRKLIKFNPEILSSIEADQDAHALKKKELRLADQKFFAEQTAPLPGLCPDSEHAVGPSGLDVGRPRLPAESLLIFLIIRGYLGSVSDQKAYMFLRESMTLHEFLHARGLKLPGTPGPEDRVDALRGRVEPFGSRSGTERASGGDVQTNQGRSYRHGACDRVLRGTDV